MKIFIMTDMEGVCGVINHDDWVTPQGRYYEEGKILLTNEVNAAVEGFFEAGATEIYIADGHGYGGINQKYLDKRTYLIRGFPDPYPFCLDETFDALAWVGQHAKAGSEYAHIAHTNWFDVLDSTINGVSVGEFGEMYFCGAFLGVRSIFASGDRAFTIEAQDLAKGIETVEVKRGLVPGKGDECTCNQYRARNLAAIHLHPRVACDLIKTGAKNALLRLKSDKESFVLPDLKSPFMREVRYRGEDGKPVTVRYSEDSESLLKLMNKPMIIREV